MRSLGSEGVAAVARASGASTLLGRVTTTSAPPPGRGRSRKVPPDDWASARANANSISPPPALCVKRNGVTRRCSASTESGVPESHKEIVSEGPVSLTAMRSSRGGWLPRNRRREAVVEGVQHVRRTLVQHHVLHFGGSEARGGGRRGDRRRSSAARRRALSADDRPDERANQRPEAERDPEFHGAPI